MPASSVSSGMPRLKLGLQSFGYDVYDVMCGVCDTFTVMGHMQRDVLHAQM